MRSKPATTKLSPRAARVREFIEGYCVVPEGAHVGKPVKLRPWQLEILETIYGSPTRTAIISVGRKNGKSALTAMLLLVHLIGPEARQNAQIYSAAQSRDQAALVFKLAAKMVRLSPELNQHVHVRDAAKELYCHLTGVFFKALSAEAKTAYGISPTFLVHDELGQVKGPSSELYDALETSCGAQLEPLSIIISTQAPTDGDLLSMLIDDARTGADPKVKAIVFEAPPDADVLDEAAWKAANPALGDFLSVTEMRGLAEKAGRMPSFESRFRNLHLNQRVNVANAFLTREVWQLNAGEPDLAAFEACPSWWGLDLSTRTDLTALVGIAVDPQGLAHVRCHFYAPQDGVQEREDRDRAPYTTWAKQGHLTLTPGKAVDYAFVAREIGDLCAGGMVQSIAFDRWRIDVLRAELEKAGIEAPLVEVGQGYKDMSPAIDALEELALNGQLRHGKHPILTWCAAGAVVVQDPAANRKLDKSKATGRIDGIVALAMAAGIHARGLVGEMPLPPSPWEDAGFRYAAI